MNHEEQLTERKTRVLVAEDHMLLRESIVYFLRVKGYKVYDAFNGADAYALIDRCRAAGVPIDLLITDMEMPAVSGRELIGRLRAEGHELPVIIMGNAMEASGCAHMKQDGNIGILDKPFRLPLLDRCIRDMLQMQSVRKDEA
ncbi:MAG: response regulator [Acidobacteriota bacterium]